MWNPEGKTEFIDFLNVWEFEDTDKRLKQLAPWAKAFVRCGGGWQAFELKKDAKYWEKNF